MVYYSVKKEIIGKVIIGKNTGKKIGLVKDISFNTTTGELNYIIVDEPTPYAYNLDLNVIDGEMVISAAAIDSIGDFIIIDEERAKIL